MFNVHVIWGIWIYANKIIKIKWIMSLINLKICVIAFANTLINNKNTNIYNQHYLKLVNS